MAKIWPKILKNSEKYKNNKPKKYCNCGIFILNKKTKYNPDKAIHMD